ncbi:MAG: hypothetical protein ACI8UO_006263 [Verrucomicrobiales bacterium]|jgi:hypothetical protein
MTTRLLLLLAIFATSCLAEDEPEFRTFFVTRKMASEQLLPFLEAAKPEIVQIGQYGAMFHGYADDEKSKGTPMQLPLQGERAVLDFQRDLNGKIHDLGLKVVGHFRLVKAYGNLEEKTGFVDYYENRWPEDLLGPKPHENLIELLQRDSTGAPIGVSRYNQGQIAFCLSSPPARQMMKQMLKVAVDHGVDGVITTYNYHLGCSCPHCRESFDDWLAERDLKFEFEEIPAKISGHPDPAEATELDWLAMRWAAENFKKNFDDIFIDYGRSLNPNLLVAQWNHLSHVSAGEERMFLPIDQWGRGESYFWESGGASFVGAKLNLKEHLAGDAWLSLLVMRELGGGKPAIMGKYDGMRLAVSTAEGFAMGGPGMGRYMRFEDPVGFEILTRYADFMHKNRRLFEGAKPAADVGLILPRQALWEGNVEAMNEFRSIGQALVEAQVQVAVIADENLTAERSLNHQTIIIPESTVLTEAQKSVLESHPASKIRIGNSTEGIEGLVSQVEQSSHVRIEAPWTLRATFYKNEGGSTLHLVNYNRDEGETKEEKGKIPGNERPIAEKNIKVELLGNGPVRSIKLHRPDVEEPLEIPFEQGESLRFTIPEILVYGVVEIDLAD